MTALDCLAVESSAFKEAISWSASLDLDSDVFRYESKVFSAWGTVVSRRALYLDSRAEWDLVRSPRRRRRSASEEEVVVVTDGRFFWGLTEKERGWGGAMVGAAVSLSEMGVPGSRAEG